MTPHVALLRGINVGGKNIISMADLRAAFTDGGYADVGTYIQSGNVTFTADGPASDLAASIATLLEDRLGVRLVVVVRSHGRLAGVVADAPPGFADEPDTYHLDVAFLTDEVSGEQGCAAFNLREGVDEAWAGDGCVYFRRLSAERTKSRMSRISQTPEYQHMTIRNWRTTTTLLGRLDDLAAAD